VVWSENDSQMAPELWDPVTGKWTEVAAMSPVPRVYHSVTVLLPDGRVFAGGGGLCGNCYGNPALNHADGQIFSPPYLFGPDGKPAPRPAITSAPGTFAPGATITVNTDRPVSAFSLVRMSTATHSINTDQRRVPLVASAVNGTSYTLPTPADRGVLVPGNYMLFAMDAGGVPSVAASVKVS
jgi:galactose oxidase